MEERTIFENAVDSVTNGEKFKVNLEKRNLQIGNKYLIKDGKPYFPIMGEFHYSRYPADMWEKELLKMKAGGVAKSRHESYKRIFEEQRSVPEWKRRQE